MGGDWEGEVERGGRSNATGTLVSLRQKRVPALGGEQQVVRIGWARGVIIHRDSIVWSDESSGLPGDVS